MGILAFPPWGKRERGFLQKKLKGGFLQSPETGKGVSFAKRLNEVSISFVLLFT
jgi:hypothetical protein